MAPRFVKYYIILQIKKQNNHIRNQSDKIREQNTKIFEQGTTIAELKRHMEEWDVKFQDLAVGLNRSREETSQSIITTSATPTTTSSIPLHRPSSYSPPRLYKSNIKPRVAQCVPRSVIINQFLEGERKRKAENLLRNPASPIPSKITRLQLNSGQSGSNKEDVRSIISSHSDSRFPSLPLFLSSSLEMLIKSPISSLKSRKRKM